MDPITIAGAFATIVGLVSNFKAERRASSDDEYRDFMEWLSDKRHDEMVDLLQSNHVLSTAIQSLLLRNHDEVIEKLNALDSQLIKLASRIEGFDAISLAISPSSELSEQSVSILQQLDESGGSFFLEMKMYGGTQYQIMDASGQISIDEPRFVDDDLKNLCSLGLLIPDYNRKGDRLFRITRASAEYLKQVQRHQ